MRRLSPRRSAPLSQSAVSLAVAARWTDSQRANPNHAVLQQALDAMRSVGVRVNNVLKNIGDTRYAFNKLQVYALPKLYRPPLTNTGAQMA